MARFTSGGGTVEGTDTIEGEEGLHPWQGDEYRFTADIYAPVVVERDDIVIDGAGYVIEGTGAEGSKGIHLKEVNNVTIKNVRVRNF